MSEQFVGFVYCLINSIIYMIHFAKVCQNLHSQITSTFSNLVPVLLDYD